MATTAQAHSSGACPVWLRAESRRIGNQRISSINSIAALYEATGSDAVLRAWAAGKGEG